MSENQPAQNKKKPLVALEEYLLNEVEKLRGETYADDDDQIDDSNIFNAKSFFADLKSKAGFGTSIDYMLKAGVADLLDRHVPKILQEMILQSYELDFDNLYDYWLTFLEKNNFHPNRITETILEHGTKLMSAAHTFNRTERGFAVYARSLKYFDSNVIIAPKYFEQIREFIAKDGPDLMFSYVDMVEDGYTKEVWKTYNDDTSDEYKEYVSHAGEATKAYESALSVLKNTQARENGFLLNDSYIRKFISKCYKGVHAPIAKAKTCSVYLNGNGEPVEDIRNDSVSLKQFGKLTVDALHSVQGFYLFHEDMNVVVGKIMYELEEQDDILSGKEFFQSSLTYLTKDREVKEEFIFKHGAVQLLRHFKCHDFMNAAELFLKIKEELEIPKDESLVFYDPTSKDKKIILAILTNFANDDEECNYETILPYEYELMIPLSDWENTAIKEVHDQHSVFVTRRLFNEFLLEDKVLRKNIENVDAALSNGDVHCYGDSFYGVYLNPHQRLIYSKP